MRGQSGGVRKEKKGASRMNEETKITIQNLLTVKSIVTMILTAVFAVLALRGEISAEQFMQIFAVVIAFYFGTQYEKASQKKGENA